MTMRRAVGVLPKSAWNAREALAAVTLSFDDRHRRRLLLVDDSGEPFLLDLDRAAVLADGDGLKLDGGGIVKVVAASEPVVEVHPQSSAEAARLAWHLGNRHTPVQVLADGTLRLRDDHVLTAMLQGLGAVVHHRSRPFDPEVGAYTERPYGHERATHEPIAGRR